jgi:hypothetical protein
MSKVQEGVYPDEARSDLLNTRSADRVEVIF